MPKSKQNLTREILTVALLLAAVALSEYWFFQLWRLDWHAPMLYGGDGIYWVGQVQRSYGDSFTRVRALVGWNNEDLRPEETRNNPYAEESGWSPMVGVEGSVRRNLFRHIDIHGDFGVSFLQDYTEYRLNVGLVFDFEGKR